MNYPMEWMERIDVTDEQAEQLAASLTGPVTVLEDLRTGTTWLASNAEMRPGGDEQATLESNPRPPSGLEALFDKDEDEEAKTLHGARATMARILVENPETWFSTHEMLDHVDSSYSNVTQTLRMLSEEGLAQREQEGKEYIYQALPELETVELQEDG